MANNGESGTGTAMMALLVGTIAGVAAGMLLAPKSGRESREQLKRKAKEGMDKAQDKVNDGKDAALSKIESAVDTTKTVARESKEAAKDAKNRVDEQTS